MSAAGRRYLAIHGRAGRIAALVPLEPLQLSGGVVLGFSPVAGRGQRVDEVLLSDEQARLEPQERLARLRVRPGARGRGVRLETVEPARRRRGRGAARR